MEGRGLEGPIPKLRFRGTFIDVASQDASDHSPRAHSEPRQPVHDRFYFEEARQYVAQLCNGDWCGSQPGNDQEQHWRTHGSERSETPQRRPLMPRRNIATREFLSARGVHASGSRPSVRSPGGDLRKTDGSPNRDGAAGQRGSFKQSEGDSSGQNGPYLSLWDLLGRQDQQGDHSPCPSWVGNAGSGSDWADRASEVGDASGNNGAHERKKKDASNRPHQNSANFEACGSNTTEFGEDAVSFFHGEWAPSHVGGWTNGPGTCSEPGARWCERRGRGRVHDVRKDRDQRECEPRVRRPVQDGDSKPSLASLSGKWLVSEGVKGMEDGVWTIEDDGRAFFNGKRFSNCYDIFENSVTEGSTVFQRGDGWTVQTDSLGSDLLVWTKDGELGNITWKRKVSATDLGGKPNKNRESHTELRSKMEASAQQMSDGWGSTGRLSSALAVIEEIPMRISEDMQRAASYVVDNMQTEVAAVSKQIRGSVRDIDRGSSSESRGSESMSRTTTEKVIKNLEVIPTMVQNLLEARVQKARDKVKHRVHGMIQNLSVIQEENWEDHEQLVTQMRLISEEVEKIAGDAVKAAAQECHAHASRQLDFALHALRDQQNHSRCSSNTDEQSAEQPDENSGRGLWEVKHDPEFWPKTVADANFTKDTMEQAVAVVQDKDYIPQSITNQVVADELLRARIRSGGGGHRGGAGTASDSRAYRSRADMVFNNPGSAGHPDFCSRPCVYHAQGRCQNGMDCKFCHMPHPKRPVRFDKQHRDDLKMMSFLQLVQIVLPILKQKAADLEFNAEVTGLLEKLWPALELLLAAAATAALVESTPESPHSLGNQVVVGNAGLGTGVPVTARSSASLHSTGVSSNASATGSERSSRQRSSFCGAFHIMGFRSLLAMLASKVPVDAVEARDLVESVLHKAREARGGRPACSSQNSLSEQADAVPCGLSARSHVVGPLQHGGRGSGSGKRRKARSRPRTRPGISFQGGRGLGT